MKANTCVLAATNGGVLWAVAALVALLIASGCGTMRVTEPGSFGENQTNISRSIHLGSRAIAVSAGAGAVWVISGKKLMKIDPASNQIVGKTAGVAGPMWGQMAVGEGAVWIPRGDILSPGLKRYDLETLQVTETIPVVGHYVSIGYGSVWATNFRKGTLSRIDPQSKQVIATVRVGKCPTYVGAGEKGVWVLNANDGTVSRIDPSSNQVAATIRIGPGTSTAKTLLGSYPACYFGLAVGAGAVWVTDYGRGAVVRIDPESNQVMNRIPVGAAPWHVTASQQTVWVETGSALVKINPQTNEVSDRVALREKLADMTSDGERLWCVGSQSDLLESLRDEP